MTNNADVILNTAFAAYNADDLDQAEALARQVLATEPANGDALYLLGLVAWRAGALEPAESLLYQAVRLYPAAENYALMLASVLEARGALDEALDFYRKFPNNPAALVQIGLIEARRGRLSFADSAFLRALELDAKVAGALVGLAQTARKRGQNKKALSYLEQAVTATPNYPDAWYQMAVQCRLMRQEDRALKAVNKAVALNPLPVFLIEQGLILEALGHPDEAFSSYRRATDTDAGFAQGWYYQGNLLRDKGNNAAAEAAYKRAIQIAPDFFDAVHNLADVLYRSGRVNEALETLRQAILINPESDTARYNLAVMLEDAGSFEEALGLYFNVLVRQNKKAPQKIEWRIAACLTALGRLSKQGYKTAVRFAQGWVKHFPDSAIAAHMLAALTHHASEKAVAYAQALYDAFADTYDAKMRQLAADVCGLFAPFLTQKSYQHVLDLGCGTGACGKRFKPMFQTLTGVDVSKNMIEKARLTGAYDTLKHADAMTFLKTTKHRFDLVLAADVICYMDDLKGVLSGIRRVLAPAGLGVFSVETGAQDGLNETGRYVWRRETVEKALAGAGLIPEKIIASPLRREGAGQAEGLIIAVRAGKTDKKEAV